MRKFLIALALTLATSLTFAADRAVVSLGNAFPDADLNEGGATAYVIEYLHPIGSGRLSLDALACHVNGGDGPFGKQLTNLLGADLLVNFRPAARVKFAAGAGLLNAWTDGDAQTITTSDTISAGNDPHDTSSTMTFADDSSFLAWQAKVRASACLDDTCRYALVIQSSLMDALDRDRDARMLDVTFGIEFPVRP